MKAATLPARTSTLAYNPPTWATSTRTGRSGAHDRFAWVSYEGAPAVLALPVVDGMDDSGETLITISLMQFSEETEPTQTFLRVVSGDVDGDFTAAEVDALIAAADTWLASMRAMRALMPATAAEHQAGTDA